MMDSPLQTKLTIVNRVLSAPEVCYGEPYHKQGIAKIRVVVKYGKGGNRTILLIIRRNMASRQSAGGSQVGFVNNWGK